jgi:hypothetical protein
MPDNRNKTGNQDKQQRPMQKEQRKDVGSEEREIQKDRETDETDEQGEITQRNPRMVDDDDDDPRGAD